MKNITKTLSAVMIAATVCTPAFAWGEREQGALLGLVLGGVIANQRQAEVPVYNVPPVQQRYIYTGPPINQQQICGYNVYCGPTSCYQEPIYDQWNRVVAYRTICR